MVRTSNMAIVSVIVFVGLLLLVAGAVCVEVACSHAEAAEVLGVLAGVARAFAAVLSDLSVLAAVPMVFLFVGAVRCRGVEPLRGRLLVPIRI